MTFAVIDGDVRLECTFMGYRATVLGHGGSLCGSQDAAQQWRLKKRLPTSL